ncbi:MAG: 2-oxo acid dehydrogenase subunit E2 [Bacteroidales bacterium]|nr:2-oxo acid dehydrogenase subunit E2 [Bacteroidales bacterium]MBN2820709.1 2-oxo acid dehydrogenase subunit E2 [Bacteroidales bacterium]
MKPIASIIVPQESVNDESVVVLEMNYNNNDFVEKDAEVIEIETSKTTMSLQTSTTGYIIYNCSVGDEVEIGRCVANIYNEKYIEQKSDSKESIKPATEVKPESTVVVTTLFSINAEKYIEENKLSKETFAGKDFVTLEDIIDPHEIEYTIEKPATISQPKTKKTKIITEAVTEEKIPKQKKKEIQYLSSVQSAGLNSVVNTFVNCSGIFEFIKESELQLKKSLLPIIVYETSRLLRKYPKLNSFFQDDSIFVYNDVNVGIAMDMDKGLKVLKIKDTDKLSIKGIEDEVLVLSNKYLEEKIDTTDLTGISFTITDLSDSDISFFTPLINMDNSGILGVSSIDKQLNRFTLSLTFDHRVTEGKYAAVFLKELKSRIESYSNEIRKTELEQKSERECFKCHRRVSKSMNENIHFLKVIDQNSNEKILCNYCLEGF